MVKLIVVLVNGSEVVVAELRGQTPKDYIIRTLDTKEGVLMALSRERWTLKSIEPAFKRMNK